MERFGCDRCWPASADEADGARSTLTFDADLVNESHFHVFFRACPGCSQRFVSVFTETIDWEHGEDPQYWTLLPITSGEASELARQGGSLAEATLEALGKDRKSLRRDHPSHEPARSYWSTGIWIGPHD